MAYSPEDLDPKLHVNERAEKLEADCDRLKRLDAGQALSVEDVRAIRHVVMSLGEACRIVLDLKKAA